MKNFRKRQVTSLEQIEKQILGPQSFRIPTISRKKLGQLSEGEVVICTSKPTGVKFLLKYNAWGFVRIGRAPDYFALYVSRPLSKVSYFGEVNEIVLPKNCQSPVSLKQASQYESFGKGKRVIVLKTGSLKRLENGIPKGFIKRLPQGIRYSTLTRFVNARTTDDL